MDMDLIMHMQGIKGAVGDRAEEASLQREAMPLLELILLVLLIEGVTPVCRLQGTVQPPELTKAGDFTLGGIFTFRTGYRGSVPTFQTLPHPPQCLK